MSGQTANVRVMADPRTDLAALVAAFERHLEACAQRRGEDDPAVVAAYDDLADAFESYDDALLEAFGEMTPLDVYGGDEDEDDEDSDEEDDEDSDEDDEDELDDVEADGDADEVYLGLDDDEFDDEDLKDADDGEVADDDEVEDEVEDEGSELPDVEDAGTPDESAAHPS